MTALPVLTLYLNMQCSPTYVHQMWLKQGCCSDSQLSHLSSICAFVCGLMTCRAWSQYSGVPGFFPHLICAWLVLSAVAIAALRRRDLKHSSGRCTICHVLKVQCACWAGVPASNAHLANVHCHCSLGCNAVTGCREQLAV